MGRANRGDVFFCVFHSLEVADGAYPAGRHEMRVDGEFRELLPAFLAHLLRLFLVFLGVAARKDAYAVARGLIAFAAAVPAAVLAFVLAAVASRLIFG